MQKFVKLFLLCAALFVSAPFAIAQPDAAKFAAPSTQQAQPLGENERLPFMVEQEQSNHAAPSSAGLMLRTFAALCLIVGLIFFAGWGWRKFGGKHFGRAPEEAAFDLKVVSTVALGSNRSLNAVRFGDKTLLVGATAQSLTLLAIENQPLRNVTAHQPRSVAALLAAENVEDFETASFADELAQAENRFVYTAQEWRSE